MTVHQAISNTKPHVALMGNLTISQGDPSVTSQVATVSDDQENAGALNVSVVNVPTGISVIVLNNNGTISATANAGCTVVPGTYAVTLMVTDNGIPVGPPLSTSVEFSIIVTANQAPSLGSYQDTVLLVGTSASLRPTAAPIDPNNNLSSLTVTPATLPGGGTLAIDAQTGIVTIITVAATTPGTYPIRVQITDSCNSTAGSEFTLTINRALTKPAAPTLLTATPVSSVQIDLKWKDNSDNETGFIIERRIGETGGFAILATTNANLAQFSNGALTPGVKYTFRVKATNSLGDSEYTNEAAATPPIVSPTAVIQFYPLAASPGKTITIFGKGFLAGGTQVFFGSERLIPSRSVLMISPSQLEVTVPPSTAGDGNINGYLTIRVVGAPDVTTQGIGINADNPSDPEATYPEYVLLGDLNGDGVVDAVDLATLRAIVLRQLTSSQRQTLAGDVFPLNSNGSRGDGTVGGIDVTTLRAFILRQISF